MKLYKFQVRWVLTMTATIRGEQSRASKPVHVCVCIAYISLRFHHTNAKNKRKRRRSRHTHAKDRVLWYAFLNIINEQQMRLAWVALPCIRPCCALENVLEKYGEKKKRERNLGELLSRFKKATATLKETGGVPCGNNDYSFSENIL